MRGDQISNLQPGDIIINRKDLSVCEITGTWMDKFYCYMYNAAKTPTFTRKDLRSGTLYRQVSGQKNHCKSKNMMRSVIKRA